MKYIRHEEVKKRYTAYIQNEISKDEKTYENRVPEEEVYSILIKEIQQLPEQCRKVYLLVLEGKSNGEIAEQCRDCQIAQTNREKILYRQLKNIIPTYILFDLLEF